MVITGAEIDQGNTCEKQDISRFNFAYEFDSARIKQAEQAQRSHDQKRHIGHYIPEVWNAKNCSLISKLMVGRILRNGLQIHNADNPCNGDEKDCRNTDFFFC